MRKMERPQRSICRLLISSMVRRVGVGVGGVGGFDLVGGNGRDVDLLGLVLDCVAAEDSGWGGGHWGHSGHTTAANHICRLCSMLNEWIQNQCSWVQKIWRQNSFPCSSEGNLQILF